MIAIRAIASYVPANFIDNVASMARFGVDLAFLEDRIGVLRVARKQDDEDTSDMCVRAFGALAAKTPVDIDRVGLVLVCTQNPDGHGMPQVSALVHAKLGMPKTVCAFDVSLACSGYVYSLSIAEALMKAQGIEQALLFTCDPYSKILDPDDRNTALLFGDAATVTLLTRGQHGEDAWTPTAFRFTTHSQYAETVNNRSGRFFMDGRSVVIFSLREVPQDVESLLAQRGVAKSDIDRYIFHQGSKYILDKLRERLALRNDQVPIAMAQWGNTVSSSIPIVLERHIADPALRRMLLCGFGVGMSIGSALLERTTTERTIDDGSH